MVARSRGRPGGVGARARTDLRPDTISAVSWLAGHRVGRQGQVVFEARWTPPEGAMLVMARMLKAERVGLMLPRGRLEPLPPRRYDRR